MEYRKKGMFYSFGWVDGGKLAVAGGFAASRREAAAKISRAEVRRLCASPGLVDERSSKIHINTTVDEKNRGSQ